MNGSLERFAPASSGRLVRPGACSLADLDGAPGVGFGTAAARIVLRLVAVLLLVSLLAGCLKARDMFGANPQEDAARGAAVGGVIGGPTGAAIGSAVTVLVGMLVRDLEKRKLERDGRLLPKRRREDETAALEPKSPFSPDPAGVPVYKRKS